MPKSNQKHSIAVFLPNLEKGGAERRMILCAIGLQQRGFQVEIIVLRQQGIFTKAVEDAGIVIRNVGKKGRFDIIGAALNTLKIFKTHEYDAVFSCLPSANVFAVLSKTLKPSPPLVFGLAAADMPMIDYSLWARLGARVQSSVSHFADKVIVNSNKGLQIALQKGFSAKKMQVIHNGVDTKQFFLDKSLGQKWRGKFNIFDKNKVIGIVARLDPAKGIETFLQAAELANEQDWYFIIFASGSSAYAEKLKTKIKSHSLFGNRLFLQENIQVDSSVYNTFDVTTISSVSESFPNVMLESMACGVPVVATDVGDCKQVLQQFGKIVPVKNHVALYSAWRSQLENEFSSIGAEVMREYILSEYSIQHMIRQFESEVQTILNEQKNSKTKQKTKQVDK